MLAPQVQFGQVEVQAPLWRTLTGGLLATSGGGTPLFWKFYIKTTGSNTTDVYMQGFQVRLKQEKVSVEHSAIWVVWVKSIPGDCTPTQFQGLVLRCHNQFRDKFTLPVRHVHVLYCNINIWHHRIQKHIHKLHKYVVDWRGKADNFVFISQQLRTDTYNCQTPARLKVHLQFGATAPQPWLVRIVPMLFHHWTETGKLRPWWIFMCCV